MLDVKLMELRKPRYLPNMLRSALNKFVGVIIDIDLCSGNGQTVSKMDGFLWEKLWRL